MTKPWRERYKVHPAADVFPMMSDDELDQLAKDIETNGLKDAITFQYAHGGELLCDGRNRLEAIERAGLKVIPERKALAAGADATAYIISKNIHRRHLTKEQRADIIVAAHQAAAAFIRQNGESIDGKRERGGQVDKIKAAAVATGKLHDISERTIERSMAKTEGRQKKKRTTKPKSYPVPDHIAAVPDDHVEQMCMPCGTPIDGMTMTGAQMKEAFRTGQMREETATLKQCEAAVYGMREWALLMLYRSKHLPKGLPDGVPAEHIERWREWIMETRNALDIAEARLKTSPDVCATAPKTV